MKFRGLTIAAAVLFALSGVLYWSNHRKPSASATSPADVPPKILALEQGDITKIDLKKKGGEEVGLAKDASGRWKMTAPKPFGVDPEALSSLLYTVSSVSSERVVEDKAGSLDQYGLAQPALEADITTKDGKTHALLIGDDTPVGAGAYAMLGGDPRVFTLASYSKTNLDKNAKDLRDKRLVTVASDKISRIELVAKKQDIEFGRNRSTWQIVRPKPLRADGSQVDDLVRKVTEAKMDLGASSEDARKAATAFASATPVATVKLTTDSGTQEFEVRKSKDGYYAKSSVVEGVYKVTSELGQGLDKGLEGFRNKKLFDFGYQDPEKIEMHDGSKTVTLSRSGPDWSSGGKKVDSASVQSFIDKIRDLSATKFPGSGFTTPAMDLAVTSSDGKRVEKVLIARAGDRTIAKRENEPALYELDTKAVEDLQKSAGDVKPALAPASPKK